MKRRFVLLGSTLALLTGCGDTFSLEPGDRDSHGTVAHVTPFGDDCYQVLYDVEPEWSCSDEQVAIAEGGIIGDEGSGSDSDVSTPPGIETALAADVSLASTECGALADLQRTALRSANDGYLDSIYRGRLSACLPTQATVYYSANGRETSHCGGDLASDADYGAGGYASGSGGASSVPVVNEGSTGDGASEYSTTNNQVEGVEEADYVKNDSGHVYVLTAEGLRIFDAWPAEETHEIGRVELPGEPRRLLLAGDRLVVFTRNAPAADPYGYEYGSGATPSSQGCTYGYDCRASSEGGSTTIVVFDVSAPANPVELERYELAGGYVASRRVGENVYAVVHYAGSAQVGLPGVDFTLDADGPGELEEQRGSLRDQIADAVAELPDTYFMPDSGGSEGCEQALAATAADGSSLLTVVSFDVAALGDLRRTVIATKPGFVYASGEALYVATDGLDSQSDPYGYYYRTPDTDVSSIHKFALDDGAPRYVGSAPVRGHVLNQFSMDESEGVLRVAATSGWVPDPNVNSTITTLGEADGKFKRLGELSGLAPTEDIRSVRFDGDRGYVVTFKKTDPLFVIGLTDPSAPAVLGELKIPGFSTYMHPIDRDHLLSIGFDADDHGDFAYFDGIQLQIFDVSDLSTPTLLHRTVIGTRGSSSEALMNHLAFNYFAPKSMLALPITVCEGGDDGVYGTEMTFSGLIAFDVSLETGFTEHGRLPFADPTKTYDYSSYGGECSAWWSSSTSNVKRSIFFDDYLVGLSDAELRVAHLDTLSTPLASLPLTDGSTEPMPLGY
jgi:hypothetical protein